MVRILIALISLSVLFGCGGGATVVKTYPAEDGQLAINHGNQVSSYNHVEQGKRLFLIGKYTQATKHFIRAITNDGGNWEAYYYMGLTQQKQGHFDRSITTLKNALKHAPDDIEIHARITYATAVSWEKDGQYERAADLYKKTLTLNPSHAPAKAGIERAQLKAEELKPKEQNPKAF